MLHVHEYSFHTGPAKGPLVQVGDGDIYLIHLSSIYHLIFN